MNNENNQKDFRLLGSLCLASGIISFFMNYFAGCWLIGITMYIYILLKYKQRNMMMTLGLVLSLVTLLVYVLAALKRSGIA